MSIIIDCKFAETYLNRSTIMIQMRLKLNYLFVEE